MADAEYSSLSLVIEGNNSSAKKSIQEVQSYLEALKVVSDAVKNVKFASLDKKMKNVVASVNELNNIKVDSSKVQKIVNSLEKLNNITEKIKNVGGLGNSTKGIKKLSENIKSLDSIDPSVLTNVTKGVSSLFNAFGKDSVNSGMSAISGMTKSVNTLVSSVQKLNGLKDIDLSNVTKSIMDMAKTIESISPEVADRMQKIADSMKSLSGMKQPQVQAVKNDSLANTSSTFNSPLKSDSSVSDVGTNNDSSVSSMFGLSGISSVLEKISPLVSKAKTVLTGLASSIGSAFKSKVQQGIKSITGFTSAIGRITMYRAIRATIKAIASAISEGLQNVYQWSLLTGNQFANSMDSIATSGMYAKNSLAAMAAPLFNALAPVIDAIVDKFVQLVNVVNQVFSIFGGSGTWIKAVKQPQKFAEAVDASGDSAKKAKKNIDNYLASFDELHVIPSPTDSSSGGGGGSDIPDYGGMFEEVPVDSSIKNFTEQLKNAINNGDWKGVGTLLGNKVNSLVDSIDFEGVGQKLGYGMNGAIQSLYYFLDTVNFYNISGGVAKLLNNAIEQIDFEYIGRLLIKKFTIPLDLLIGFVMNFDWGQLASKISDGIIGAFNEVSDWILKYNWGAVGSQLMQSIINFVTNIDYAGIVTSLVTMTGNILNSWYEFLYGAIGNLCGNVASVASEWLSNTTPQDILNGLNAFITNLFDGVLGVIMDIPKWVKDHIVSPFVKGFTDGWDAQGGEMTDKVGNTWNDITDKTTLSWTDIKNFLSNTWDSAQSKTRSALASMQSKTETTWGKISSVTTSKWAEIRDTVQNKFNEIGQKTNTTWDGMKTTIGTTWDTIRTNTKNTVVNMSQSVSTTFSGLSSSISNIFNGIKTFATTTWDKIKQAMVSPIESAKNTIKGIVDTIKSFFNFTISWPHIPMPHFGINPRGWSIGDLLKGSIPTLSVNWYANGGFPNAGEMFIARENGPELVGNIGGRTAVANNDQIVTAVSNGVRDAIMSTMSSNDGNSNINLTVYLDGDVVYKSVVKRNNQKVKQTGMSELLV